MKNYQKYNLLVTWNVRYHECRCCAYSKEEIEEIEFPEWLRIKKSDVDSNGTFYSVEKLENLNVENDTKTYTIINAQLVRKLSIGEEISDDSSE